MQRGEALEGTDTGPATLPTEHLQTVVGNTIAVLTAAPERRAEWRGAVAAALQDAQQQGADWQIEVELYTAVLALLDGQQAALPDDHPYAGAIAAITQGVAQEGAQP